LNGTILKEKFEDIKGIITSCKLKKGKQSIQWQKKRSKKTYT